MSAPARDAIAEVLTGHWPQYVDSEVGFVCGCDEYGELHLPTVSEVGRHLADAIVALARPENEVKAEALRDAAKFFRTVWPDIPLAANLLENLADGWVNPVWRSGAKS
jgi:hypothetical protein